MTTFYYRKGQYEPSSEEIKRKKKSGIKRMLIIVISVSLVIGVYVKAFVYTEQYYWTNKLISAINRNDEKSVEKLLQIEGMDVNRKGGVDFPTYLIPLDEFSRISPIEEASFQQNYKIVKMLLDYGATENLDASLVEALNDYDEDVNKIVGLLLEHGASVNQIEGDSSLLECVAEWDPDYIYIQGNPSRKEIESGIVEVYDTIYRYSIDASVKAAEKCKNEELLKYLKKKE